MNQKWINEGGVFYPISGNVILHVTPGPGVYEIVQPGAPADRRIGLSRLYDKFEFTGKVYQISDGRLLDRIKKVWNSDLFVDGKKSIGIILNGLKGSGKTWTAKQIANEMDMPVLIVDNSFEGDILSFIRTLNFSCTILVDEAEKIFKLGDDDDVLLRMIDNAGSNVSRHLFVLTTNTLDVNPNLLGRTGRIRYLVNFRNLSESLVKEYIDDNLDPKYHDLKEQIIDKVNLLEYSSIDLLRSIIEEVNITGEVDSPDTEIMNIPICRYSWDIVEFENADWGEVRNIRKFISENNPERLPLAEWLKKEWTEEGSNEKLCNEDRVENLYPHVYLYKKRITSRFSHLWKDCDISCGSIIQEPDADGYFSYLENYSKDECICAVLKQKNNPGLYSKTSFLL